MSTAWNCLGLYVGVQSELNHQNYKSYDDIDFIPFWILFSATTGLLALTFSVLFLTVDFQNQVIDKLTSIGFIILLIIDTILWTSIGYIDIFLHHDVPFTYNLTTKYIYLTILCKFIIGCILFLYMSYKAIRHSIYFREIDLN